MGDNDNAYQLGRPQAYGYQLKLQAPELKLKPQRYTLFNNSDSVWIVPLDVEIRPVGQANVLKLRGKIIDGQDRRSYLLQAPEPPADPSVGLSIYSDKTPDPFTRNEQFSMGLTGFRFGGLGKLFIQGSADHPNYDNLGGSFANHLPVQYTSYQFNISSGEIPLVVLNKVTITPQVGVDLRTGSASINLDIEFKKNAFLNSINVNVNNLSTNWRTRVGMDSVQVLFDIPLPLLIL